MNPTQTTAPQCFLWARSGSLQGGANAERASREGWPLMLHGACRAPWQPSQGLFASCLRVAGPSWCLVSATRASTRVHAVRVDIWCVSRIILLTLVDLLRENGIFVVCHQNWMQTECLTQTECKLNDLITNWMQTEWSNYKLSANWMLETNWIRLYLTLIETECQHYLLPLGVLLREVECLWYAIKTECKLNVWRKLNANWMILLQTECKLNDLITNWMQTECLRQTEFQYYVWCSSSVFFESLAKMGFKFGAFSGCPNKV